MNKFSMLAFIVAFSVGAARADSVVTETTGLDIAVGQIVGADARFDLAAGQSVTMINPDGTMIKLVGPFRGGINDVPKAAQTDIGALKALFSSRKLSTASIGAVRSAKDIVALPSPWVVNVRAGGSYCTRIGEPVVLWNGGRPVRDIIVRDDSATWQERMRWPTDAATARVVTLSKINQGGAFSFQVDGDIAPITLHVIPRGLTEAAQLAYVINRGCDAQAELLTR